ncbi:MAG: exopolysaccharide biosynthesis protein [Chlamydiae bacterium]|nr:exopolysaccharide biosynthesis protein [Chlamydiota bacterium]
MKSKNQVRSLEDAFLFLGAKNQKVPLTIERMLKVFSGKARDLLILMLSIPFSTPLQLPALSTPFGILIGIIGIRMLIGRQQVWLPERFLNKTISTSILKKVSKSGVKVSKFLKKFSRIRIVVVIKHPVFKMVNAILITILGILLAQPLPIPFTNMTSAWSLIFLAFGLVEDDGLFVLLGYLASVFTFIFFIEVGVFFARVV